MMFVPFSLSCSDPSPFSGKGQACLCPDSRPYRVSADFLKILNIFPVLFILTNVAYTRTYIKGLCHETEFKYGWKWIVLGIINKNLYWFFNFHNALFFDAMRYWRNLKWELFLQYIFTLTAGKMANALAHQAAIL